VGATQEETGYKSSIGVAKIDILDEITRDMFESDEEEVKHG